jgi:hypothetical protein
MRFNPIIQNKQTSTLLNMLHGDDNFFSPGGRLAGNVCANPPKNDC